MLIYTFTAYSALVELDRVYYFFLDELGISDEAAVMHLNFLPLGLRRDIAMLGVIHRAVIREGPPLLREFFIPEDRSSLRTSHRYERRHSRNLKELFHGQYLENTRRLFFGGLRVYNLFPQWVVKMSDTASFQSALTSMARARIAACDNRWRT